LTKLYNSTNVTYQSIKQIFDNISEAMTSSIRQNSDGQYVDYSNGGLANSTHAASAHGTVIATETCIRIAWDWVAYPAASVIMSIIFLVGVIRHSASTLSKGGAAAEIHDWKGDPLLLLRAHQDGRGGGNLKENVRKREGIPSQSTEAFLSNSSKKVRAILEFEP
jgi:hypothetical protein